MWFMIIKQPLFHIYLVARPGPELARQFLAIFVKWGTSEKYISSFICVKIDGTTSDYVSPHYFLKANK